MAQGLNADCIFKEWPLDRQMAAYRQLSRIQDPNDQAPDLTLLIDNNGRRLVRRDGENMPACAPPPERPKEKAPVLPRLQVVDTEREQRRAAYEAERVAHPERLATRIEDVALKALNGDEQARLDLRVQLEKLMKDPNKDYRDKVLKRMEDDGAYGVFNMTSDRPHVTITRDRDGNPRTVEFSRRLGIDKQTIPVWQTVEEQVATAQRGYVEGLKKLAGGMGMDAAATVKAVEILNGEEPGVLRWFHLHRKAQGRPAIDPELL